SAPRLLAGIRKHVRISFAVEFIQTTGVGSTSKLRLVHTFTQLYKKVMSMKINRNFISLFLSILAIISHSSSAWASLLEFVYPPSLVEGKNQIPINVAEGSREKQALVVGTTGAEAQSIGVQMLKKGGNAVDAAIATAMGQIVLAAGSWVSFAGVTNIM